MRYQPPPPRSKITKETILKTASLWDPAPPEPLPTWGGSASPPPFRNFWVRVAASGLLVRSPMFYQICPAGELAQLIAHWSANLLDPDSIPSHPQIAWMFHPVRLIVIALSSSNYSIRCRYTGDTCKYCAVARHY